MPKPAEDHMQKNQIFKIPHDLDHVGKSFKLPRDIGNQQILSTEGTTHTSSKGSHLCTVTATLKIQHLLPPSPPKKKINSPRIKPVSAHLKKKKKNARMHIYIYKGGRRLYNSKFLIKSLYQLFIVIHEKCNTFTKLWVSALNSLRSLRNCIEHYEEFRRIESL